MSNPAGIFFLEPDDAGSLINTLNFVFFDEPERSFLKNKDCPNLFFDG